MPEIEDYIDPKCSRHMMAYLYMETQGSWPESFKRLIKEDNITFNNPGWKETVASKFANEWIKARLFSGEYKDTINGMDRGFHMPNTGHLKMQGVEIIRRE